VNLGCFMKRFCGITIALLALNVLSGCRHGCGERHRLFDRGRDSSSERAREEGNGRDCDNCHSPVSRTGYPSLGTPVSNNGMMPYAPGGYSVMPGGFTGGDASNDPRVLPAPMPTIPPPGVPEYAQPLPTGPSSVLPMPNIGPGRPVSK